MSETRGKSVILNQFIPYRLANLSRRVSDSLSKIYQEEFNLTVPEWRILANLAEQNRQSARDIGEVTLMDKSKVSRAVKQLDSKGYLLKERDSEDNRVMYLSMSESGRELYHAIVPRALDWESGLISALDISEYRDLMRILEKLDCQLDISE